MRSMAMARQEPPIVFRADHPFLFLIRDDRSGAILFMGRVTDPTK
jgi:serpin B